jgi:hypothetical protein
VVSLNRTGVVNYTGFSTIVCYGRFSIATNGLALGEEADFEAQNRLPALNLIRSTKLHLSTEPAFLPNACYHQYLLVLKTKFRILYENHISYFGQLF